MRPKLASTQRADLTFEQRLDRIERTLDRICAELDIAINAMRVLLEHAGLARKAESLGEQLDQIHAEREDS